MLHIEYTHAKVVCDTSSKVCCGGLVTYIDTVLIPYSLRSSCRVFLNWAQEVCERKKARCSMTLGCLRERSFLRSSRPRPSLFLYEFDLFFLQSGDMDACVMPLSTYSTIITQSCSESFSTAALPVPEAQTCRLHRPAGETWVGLRPRPKTSSRIFEIQSLRWNGHFF